MLKILSRVEWFKSSNGEKDEAECALPNSTNSINMLCFLLKKILNVGSPQGFILIPVFTLYSHIFPWLKNSMAILLPKPVFQIQATPLSCRIDTDDGLLGTDTWIAYKNLY